MEYDKRRFQKLNSKKILHKVKKHWVVVSMALLMAIGGKAAMTQVHAQADTNSGGDSVNVLRDRINKSLIQSQQGKSTLSQNHQSNTYPSRNSVTHQIVKRANQLHSSILSHATIDANQSQVQSITSSHHDHQSTPASTEASLKASEASLKSSVAFRHALLNGHVNTKQVALPTFKNHKGNSGNKSLNLNNHRNAAVVPAPKVFVGGYFRNARGVVYPEGGQGGGQWSVYGDSNDDINDANSDEDPSDYTPNSHGIGDWKDVNHGVIYTKIYNSDGGSEWLYFPDMNTINGDWHGWMKTTNSFLMDDGGYTYFSDTPGGNQASDIAYENVNYYYNGQPEGSYTAKGVAGGPGVANGYGITHGFQLAHDGSSDFTYSDTVGSTNSTSVNVQPMTVTDTIDYIENHDTSNVLGSTSMSGTYGSDTTADGSNMPVGYQLANDGTQDFTFGNGDGGSGTHYVDIAPNYVNDTITYETTSDTFLTSTNLGGNYGTDAQSAIDNYFNNSPYSSNYTISRGDNVTYGTSNITVYVTPDTENDQVTYQTPSDAVITSTNVSGPYHTSAQSAIDNYFNSSYGSNYTISSGDDAEYGTGNITVTVNRNSEADNVTYKTGYGDTVGSTTVTGPYGLSAQKAVDDYFNSHYSTYYTISNGDKANYGSGGITVYLNPDSVPDEVDYELNSGALIGSTTLNGPYHESAKSGIDDYFNRNYASHYTLVSGDNVDYGTGKIVVTINPDTESDRVNYQTPSDVNIASTNISGSYHLSAQKAIDDYFNSNYGSNYTINHGDNAEYGTGTITVTVNRDNREDNVTYKTGYGDVVGNTTISGPYGLSAKNQLDSYYQSHYASNYTISSGDNVSYGNNPITVYLAPDQRLDEVSYELSDGHQVSDTTIHGPYHESAKTQIDNYFNSHLASNYTISSGDNVKYGNGKFVVTVHADTKSDQVTYKTRSDHVVGSTNISGPYHYSAQDAIDNYFNSNYSMNWSINSGDVGTRYGIGNITVYVTANPKNIFVEYQGTEHDQAQQTGIVGVNGQKVSVLNWVRTHVPQGYHLDRTVDNNALSNYTIGSNGYTGSHYSNTNPIVVKVDPDNVRVPITLADADNHSQVVMTIYASDLFTVGVPEQLQFNGVSVVDQLTAKGFSGLNKYNNYNYTVQPSDVNSASQFSDTDAYHKRPVLYVDPVGEGIPIQFKVGYQKIGGVTNFGINGNPGSSVDIIDNVRAPEGYDLAPGQNGLRTYYIDPNHLPSIANPAVVQLLPHRERLQAEFVDASDVNRVIDGGYLMPQSDTIGSTVNLLNGYQLPSGYYLDGVQNYNQHYQYNSGFHTLNYTLTPSDIQTDGNPGTMKMMKIYLTPVKSGIPVEYIGVDMDQVYNTGQSGPNGGTVNIEDRVTTHVPKGYHIENPSVEDSKLKNYVVGSTGYSGRYLNPLTIKVDRNQENVPVHFLDQNGHPVGTTQYVRGLVNGDPIQLPTVPREGNTPIHGYTFDSGNTLYTITPPEVEYDGNPGTTFPVPLTLVGHTGVKVPVIYKTLQNVQLNSQPYDVTGQVGSDVNLTGGIPSGYTLVGGQNAVNSSNYLIKGQNLTSVSGYTQTGPQTVYVTTNQQPLTINYIDPKNHFFLYSREIPSVTVGKQIYLDKDNILDPNSNSYLNNYTPQYKYGDYNDLRGYKLASDGYYGTHQNPQTLEPIATLQGNGAYPAYNVYMEGLPVTVRVTYQDPNNHNRRISQDDITKNVNGSDATTGDTVQLPLPGNANRDYNLSSGYTLDSGQITNYQIRAADTTGSNAVKNLPLLATGDVVHTRAPVTVINIDSDGRLQGTHQIYVPISGHVGDHLNLNSLEFKGYIPQGYELARGKNNYNQTEYDDNGRGHDYDAILMPSDSVSDSRHDGYTNWDSFHSWQGLNGTKQNGHYRGYWDVDNNQPLVVIQAKQSNSNTITIHFVNQAGQVVGQTPAQGGDVGDSLGIGPNDWIIKDNMPQGYHYDSRNNFQTQVSYTGSPQNLDVMVAGDQVTKTVPLTLNLKTALSTWKTQSSSLQLNGPVGSVQTYNAADYAPQSSKPNTGYVVDHSGIKPVALRIRINPDGGTILNEFDSHDQPIQNGTGQFWYRFTDYLPATVKAVFLDQHGQSIGCPVYRSGSAGQTFDLMSDQGRKFYDSDAYTVAGDSDSGDHGQDQYRNYALQPGMHIVYIHLIGKSDAGAQVVANCRLQQSDGSYKQVQKTIQLKKNKRQYYCYGDSDWIDVPQINGYSPTSSDAPQDVTITPNGLQPQALTFNYTKEPTGDGTLLVHYVNPDGQVISSGKITEPVGSPVTLSGSFGAPLPEGYSLNGGDQKSYTITKALQDVYVPVTGNQVTKDLTLYRIKQGPSDRQQSTEKFKVELSGHVGETFHLSPYGFHYLNSGSDQFYLIGISQEGESGWQKLVPNGYYANASDQDQDVTVMPNGQLSTGTVAYGYTQSFLPVNLDKITVHYVTGSGQVVDTVSDHGIKNDVFDIQPYLDDLPADVENNYELDNNGPLYSNSSLATPITDTDQNPIKFGTLSDVYIKLNKID